MAAKSKKAAVKKVPRGKRAPSRGEIKASELDVAADVPDLMTSTVVKQLAQVESVIGQLDLMTDRKLAEK